MSSQGCGQRACQPQAMVPAGDERHCLRRCQKQRSASSAWASPAQMLWLQTAGLSPPCCGVECPVRCSWTATSCSQARQQACPPMCWRLQRLCKAPSPLRCAAASEQLLASDCAAHTVLQFANGHRPWAISQDQLTQASKHALASSFAQCASFVGWCALLALLHSQLQSLWVTPAHYPSHRRAGPCSQQTVPLQCENNLP